MTALLKSAQAAQSCSVEASIFRRKWQAGIAPDKALPAYEDIVLGGLGRLADRLMVLERQASDDFKVLRCGRGLQRLLGPDADGKSVGELPREFAGPL